jgi:tetratricopeptide (TPR) repeat protein
MPNDVETAQTPESGAPEAAPAAPAAAAAPAAPDPASTAQVQNLFNRGFAAFERGNLSMAIDLLARCAELAPGFLRARKFLHAAEIQRALKGSRSPLHLRLAELLGLPAFLKATALHRTGKTAAAVVAAEKALRAAPLSRKHALLFADVAEAAGEPAAAVMSLELLTEQFPEDGDLLARLGAAYQRTGDWRKGRDTFSKLVSVRPRDPDALKLLKDAEAHLTMQSGGWEDVTGGAGGAEKDGYRKLMRDQKLASTLDMQNKAVVTGQDAEALIAEQRAKIAAEPRNLNYYRGLARLFQQQKRFAEAVATLEDARRINPADPELDRSLSGVRVQDFDSRIAAARESGDIAAAERLLAQRNQFVFDDLVTRVERYPNDLRLRYELGLQYFQYQSYDDAIQQLQLSQRSPRERTDSLYYLARCFRAKGQKDLAVMQLDTALSQLPVMDDSRKQVLFELGELAEENGDQAKAFDYYKEVYGADIGYRDIGAKMDRLYKARKAAGQG